MNKETQEWIDRLTDHPADRWMREYMFTFKPSDVRLLRTLSGKERKILWRVVKEQVSRTQRITSYLELGVNCGASMWLIYPFMAESGIMVGVDKNNDPNDERVKLRGRVMEALAQWLMDTIIIDKDTRDSVSTVQAMSPFDLLLIDGDHSYEGVSFDWEHYVPMVRDGGMVILHDVSNMAFGVHRLWEERREELAWHSTHGNLGVGVK